MGGSLRKRAVGFPALGLHAVVWACACQVLFFFFAAGMPVLEQHAHMQGTDMLVLVGLFCLIIGLF